ncbi:MAG: N-acetyltransferase [Actinobacteria bacterium]|nr:MAG: N-acetyltransferase [Actinomycetota bacterium]
MLRKASKGDLHALAHVYKNSFPDSMRHIFGGPPPDQPLVDIYGFLLDEFPDYFLVAEEEGEVAGYVIAPPDISPLVRHALLRGYALRWAWRWLTGRYGFGVRVAWILLADKLALLANKGKAAENSDARILSVAVDPAHQGKGLGMQLAVAGIDLLRKAGAESVMLEVRANNGAALHLYRKLGFHEVGRFEDKVGVWIQMVTHVRPAAEKAA